MPLVHKYDCVGIKYVMDDMNNRIFFSGAPKELTVLNSSTGQATGHYYLNVGKQLTQEHIDYIIIGQEFYGADFLNSNMKYLLACLLTYNVMCIVSLGTEVAQWNIYQGTPKRTEVTVEKKQTEGSAKAPVTGSLVIREWRLTAATLASLLPMMQAQGMHHMP